MGYSRCAAESVCKRLPLNEWVAVQALNEMKGGDECDEIAVHPDSSWTQPNAKVMQPNPVDHFTLRRKLYLSCDAESEVSHCAGGSVGLG